jgi:hypothetical protein
MFREDTKEKATSIYRLSSFDPGRTTTFVPPVHVSARELILARLLLTRMATQDQTRLVPIAILGLMKADLDNPEELN